MKRIVLAAATIAMVVVLAGCSSIVRDQRFTGPLEVKVSAKIDPMISLKSGQPKVASSATVHSLFWGLINWGPTKFADGVAFNQEFSSFGFGLVEMAKRAAAYNFCQQSGSDILVAPRYVLTVNDFIIYRRTKAVVEAFPATLEGVKIAQSQN